jgi:hypothetical protein
VATVEAMRNLAGRRFSATSKYHDSAPRIAGSSQILSLAKSLTSQLKPFGSHAVLVVHEPGDVAARFREALDIPGSHRIAHHREYDRRGPRDLQQADISAIQGIRRVTKIAAVNGRPLPPVLG